ncbi:MAG: hypothetical protein BHW65_01375 [Verrucomicrobia bacterium CAG:312_58_20]|nr:MAG: hypothetical protein BHW65_01375 [Verrucomicrobia bacterium CAG:312_58_20]PWL68846.1 MAG: hypothetical protein DBY30_02160 [Verrucomicrobiota bacterium]
MKRFGFEFESVFAQPKMNRHSEGFAGGKIIGQPRVSGISQKFPAPLAKAGFAQRKPPRHGRRQTEWRAGRRKFSQKKRGPHSANPANFTLSAY